ncbi:MAG: SGNH/GDSL hydrolase family protein [Pseudomonadota bacterium]|nr:SGNH/GDSL hydrolase family protein [Pseudomonadota bacterium]
MKELFQQIAAVTISLIIFIIALEVTLQIYTRIFIYYDVEMSRYAVDVKIKSDDPNIGHEHTPGANAYLMGVDVKINSDGMRDSEYTIERNAKHRIAFLGDSLTFGWGVDKVDTFESQLEVILSKTQPTEILNFGHGNFNTQQQVSLFKKTGLKYQPDQAVVFYFINDAEVTPVRSNWLWLSHLRSVTFLWSRIRGLLTRSNSGQTFESFYKDLYQDDKQGLLAVKSSFLELQDICLERNIQLQVVMLPELHNLIDYPFKLEYKKISGFLEDNNIDVIDLTDSFLGYKPSEDLWVAPDDAHPNALAHKMIAEFTSDFIGQKGILNE